MAIPGSWLRLIGFLSKRALQIWNLRGLKAIPPNGKPNPHARQEFWPQTTCTEPFRRDIAYRNLRVEPHYYPTITLPHPSSTMSNRTSKSINPSLKITSYFKPAQRAADTNTGNATSSEKLSNYDHQGTGAGNLSLPMRNPGSGGSIPVKDSPNSSFSDASVPSSSMPGSQTNSRVIPSSDGEDESEDSDGLEDPQKMFGGLRKNNSAAPAAKKNPRSKSPARVASAIPKAMAPPSYKFSLDNLVAEKAKSVALDQEILRSRALFEEANREYTENNASDSGRPVSEGMLEDAFGEGTARRLLAALNRKDAWRIDRSWHFYDMDKVHEKPRKNPFPKQALRESGWSARLACMFNRSEF